MGDWKVNFPMGLWNHFPLRLNKVLVPYELPILWHNALLKTNWKSFAKLSRRSYSAQGIEDVIKSSI